MNVYRASDKQRSCRTLQHRAGGVLARKRNLFLYIVRSCTKYPVRALLHVAVRAGNACGRQSKRRADFASDEWAVIPLMPNHNVSASAAGRR